MHLVQAAALFGQPQDDAPAVLGMRCPAEQLPIDEPGQHPRERAGMDVQHRRQLAGRDAGKPAHDADDEALRARHSEIAVHALRRALQRMIHGPQQAHETQDFREITGIGCSVFGSWRASRTRLVAHGRA